MAESSAAGSQRVALLARPGKAADNLTEALRQSGAELVLVADPNVLDEATLLAARPQAVLVALEPGIESAVDRLDAVLSSPSLTVIFDEADLAAHRAGWDAARWARHLSAKLNRHQRVLPPGGEAETEEWYPSPGHLPEPSSAFADLDLNAFAQEAAARAGSVPADGMNADTASSATPFDTLVSVSSQAVPVAGSEGGDPWGDDAGLDVAEMAIAGRANPPPSAPTLETAPIAEASELAVETNDIETKNFDAKGFDAFDLDAFELDALGLEAVEMSAVDTAAGDTAAGDMDAIEFDTLEIEAFDAEIPAIEASVPAPEARSVQPLQFDDDAFFLESLSAGAARPAAFDDAPIASFSSDFDLDITMPPPLPDAMRKDEADLRQDDSNEELAGRPLDFALDVSADAMPKANDAPPPAAESRSTARNLDLTSLDARISSLSLVEIERPAETAPKEMPAYVDFTNIEGALGDSAAAAPPAPVAQTAVTPEPMPAAPPMWDAPPPSAAMPSQAATRFSPPSDIGRGLVVIEAGLGGPDPVRQVLAGLPASFPMPVLVRLHLQGGRYDRLVAQMERAASLPVMLAQVGDFVRAGCIYFLPEGIGLNAMQGGFEFIAHPSPALTIFAALPAQDSAVLFLSGSDAGLIEDAMQAVDDGALVVAQSPEDCYDGAACAYLRSRGAASGLPPELAARLVARWPS